ncbi:MAG TPA: HPr family phosphocarrier protein [Kiritimatiellia bacterium]|nr:HPr family phosphocarrier protein [Kiritimatiellia bacterium]HPJ56019.1 HPr family phosphocarrier protein [Kiritimatiellia bacterium]HPR68001.1 HPr family phosphocarrier protein [Kiritimatiellia bacterium]HRX05586.1 HPr family phosphocarrier protein [Kiritimatiellia bacterium]
MSPDPESAAKSPEPLSRDVVVQNRYGIHARPAALLVKTASRFACEILLEKNGVKVNAKSIMGLLTLEGHHGSKLRILASGADAADALQALAELFEQKFFED